MINNSFSSHYFRIQKFSHKNHSVLVVEKFSYYSRYNTKSRTLIILYVNPIMNGFSAVTGAARNLVNFAANKQEANHEFFGFLRGLSSLFNQVIYDDVVRQGYTWLYRTQIFSTLTVYIFNVTTNVFYFFTQKEERYRLALKIAELYVPGLVRVVAVSIGSAITILASEFETQCVGYLGVSIAALVGCILPWVQLTRLILSLSWLFYCLQTFVLIRLGNVNSLRSTVVKCIFWIPGVLALCCVVSLDESWMKGQIEVAARLIQPNIIIPPVYSAEVPSLKIPFLPAQLSLPSFIRAK